MQICIDIGLVLTALLFAVLILRSSLSMMQASVLERGTASVFLTALLLWLTHYEPNLTVSVLFDEIEAGVALLWLYGTIDKLRRNRIRQ